jgi:hypothetical protein
VEWIAGNLFIRPNRLARAGDKTAGHAHNFDHVSIVFRGRVHVRATLPDGRVIERDFGMDDPNGRHFLVKADVLHEITALEDDTEYWCVYSHRQPNGDVIQHYDGWDEAYR